MQPARREQQLDAAESVSGAGNVLSWLPARQIETLMKTNGATDAHIGICTPTHPRTLFQTDPQLLACMHLPPERLHVSLTNHRKHDSAPNTRL